jgi:hypothetical protein
VCYLLAFVAGGCVGAVLGVLMAAPGTPEPSVYRPDSYEG